jgi:hypothetical protein
VIAIGGVTHDPVMLLEMCLHAGKNHGPLVVTWVL